ncbi:MAG: fatty acid desaturase [Gemmatimonadetes bacterium]|nr:fatty acid desaturase [Gemmatimonadota bacterium]
MDAQVDRAWKAFLRVHGPTWLVAAAVYGGWIATTLAHRVLPFPLLFAVGGVLVAWHGSLQHETIHGHPAGPRWVGAMLGAPSLALWLPYAVYRDTHRRHHMTEHLTDPAHDPESQLGVRDDLLALGPVGRALASTQRTLLGRVVLGPPIVVARFLASELVELARRTPGRWRAWALHLVGVAIIVVWLIAVAHMPLWKYLVAFVYPGAGLTLLRSFTEHRADASRARRTTVVEAGLFFRLLFLNNNFHVVHHAAPRLPWFELPERWTRERASFASEAADLVLPGYGAIVRKHALHPLSQPPPAMR